MINPIIAQAVAFTDTYKQYQNAPLAIREAMCFKAQYPVSQPNVILAPIETGDLFAGRHARNRIAYVGSIMWLGLPHCTADKTIEGKQSGYCFDFSALYRLPQTDEERTILEELSAFWKKECNLAHIYAHSDIQDSVGFLVSHDLDRLVKKGLPGLREDVTAMPDSDFRTGLLLVLETVTDVCRYYQQQATAQGREDIAERLSAIMTHAPETLAEALQLIWMIELLSHERHYENNRFDVALGDLYAQNIDSGALTEEAAIEQIRAFYQMVNENGEVTVCRLIMGGRGRRNPEKADRFIEAALKAAQRHKRVTPQVTLRLYEGMNPALLTLAYDTINETCTFPTLYNDDAIIDGVKKAFGVSTEVAEDYYPLGCGEYMIAHTGPSILCTSWNIPKMINTALRANDTETFEDLYATVHALIRQQAVAFAQYHQTVIDVNRAANAYLIASLLTDDCLQRGKPILAGGARYMGACVMGHGFSNAADALTAIKKVVYDDKAYTLDAVRSGLDANFDGCEPLRKALLAAPKYGNDDDEADAMLTRLWRDMSDAMKEAGQAKGFDFHTVSSVNPGGYALGAETGATADGRLANEPFAIGNAPTAGFDKNGLTALMNSILKTDPENGGSTTNFKISRAFFTDEREKFEALFSTYWAGGGLQANITVVNRGDLEAAMEAPEKYPHLLVRLGGWTARFIDLERPVQEEILNRTLY